MAEITKMKRSSQCKFKTCPRLWWRQWAPNEKKSRLIWRYTSLISLFVDFRYDLHDITHHWTSHVEFTWSHRWYECSCSASIIMQNECVRTDLKQSISDCTSTSFEDRPRDSNSTFQPNKCRHLWNIKLEIFLSLGHVNKQWRHCNEQYKKHLSAQIGASNREMVIECGCCFPSAWWISRQRSRAHATPTPD